MEKDCFSGLFFVGNWIVFESNLAFVIFKMELPPEGMSIENKRRDKVVRCFECLSKSKMAVPVKP